MVSVHLRVRRSFLLLELASCVAGAPVLSVDVGKDGVDVPMFSENAAVFGVSGAEKYMDVVEGSTPVRANAGFEYEKFSFREAVSHAFVHDSSGVVDTSGFLLFKLLSYLYSALAFLV